MATTTIKTAAQLAERAIDVAKNYKTLYVMGCIGAPMTESNKATYIAHHEYNQRADRKPMIKAATADTFGFDCVCLIKALLWGWNGDKSKTYGGAVYKSNNVPDINADGMINVCKEVSTNFSKIEIGEAVWMPGHIGIYVGDGLAVECTPIWKNGVQITACNQTKSGYNRRNWTKHGKLPYVSYNSKNEGANKQKETSTGSVLYYVQSGAFSKKPLAHGHMKKIKDAGFNAIIKKEGNYYKIQMGPFSKKADADAQVKKLKAKGFDAFVTTNSGSGASGTAASFNVGDKVKCNAGVTKFSDGSIMLSWVPSSVLYVRAVENSGKILLVSTEPTKAIYTGRVNASDVHKI